MDFSVDDTIAAIASPPGGALRGIVRVSGPDAVRAVAECFRAEKRPDWPAIRDATVVTGAIATGPPLGEVACLLYLWPTNRSYTGQPCAELHAIGSTPVLEGILEALFRQGIRPAGPGEFTLRAFLAGRLDLTQAEAVLGVIDARSRCELNVALEQLAGGLSSPLNRLRDRLLDSLAHLEAGLDFVEEDIEFISSDELCGQLREAIDQVTELTERMRSRGTGDYEPRVVLIGRPNVGKSSLLNALTGAPAALVADQAGTTRDYLSRHLDLDGRRFLLIDTAGIDERKSLGDVERRARSAALREASRAHVRLLCLDATRAPSDEERRMLTESAGPSRRILALTKSDRTMVVSPGDFRADESSGIDAVVAVSSVTGEGLPDLAAAIARSLAAGEDRESGAVAGSAIRCGHGLARAARHLKAGYRLAAERQGEELVAAELRMALDELGQVVGAVYTDDILDRIFSRFCIGK